MTGEEFADQISNVAGIELTKEDLDEAGLNIMVVERLINSRLGVTRSDDTLPKRWFEEAIGVGPYKGEKIERSDRHGDEVEVVVAFSGG